MKSIGPVAATGVAWTGGATLLTTALYFVQLTVLARLLAPADFGLMAMVMVVLGLLSAFVDMGISNAIIHRQDTGREQLSSLYWLNIFAGVAIYCAVILVAPLAAALFGEARLTELIMWAGLVTLVIPLGQQFQILLQKQLRFKVLVGIEVCGAFAGSASSIGLALYGFGVYALVWGYVFGALITSLLALTIGWNRWRPRLYFRWSEIRGYLSFGLFQLGERTANYIGSRVDQLLLGTFLGAEALGYYSLALNLVMLPVQRLNPAFTRVAFPIFARIQTENERLRHSYMRLVEVVAASNFPLFFIIAAAAPVFVDVFWGEKWAPSIILIQILAFVALLRSTGNPVGSLLLAKGRADLGFYWTLLFLFTQTPAIYVAARQGDAVTVAQALLALQLVYYWLNYAINIRPLIGPCLGEYVASLVPAALTSVLAAIGVLAFGTVQTDQRWQTLALQLAGGAAIYLSLNWLFYRKRIVELVASIRARDA